MKIRSLLLGSVAAAGLSTGGAFAADLGVLTSLDLCDELGLSGLTISSDDNCLVITGGVTYEFNWGDYNDSAAADADIAYGGVSWSFGDGTTNWDDNIEAWVQFAATSNTDFGKATAVIKLMADGASDDHVEIDEAYVSIGDTTVITAGVTGSIFNLDDDEPLDWLGGFIAESVDSGVGYGPEFDSVGGNGVIQITHDLGNGFSISGALEELDNNNSNFDGTAIGTVAYSGDGISAHVSLAATDIFNDSIDTGFVGHAGFAGEFDNFKVVLAGAFADENYVTEYGFGTDAYWNVLASASATFDMFTIAASVEATSEDEWGVSGSVGAEVTEGVSLNLGARYLEEDSSGNDIWQVSAGVTADVTETLEATAEVGYVDDDWADLFYGSAGLTWTPGGDYEASITGTVNSEDAYKIETSFSKEFQ
jgi:hypothetical protein